MYRLDNLSYPSSGDGLNALISPPAGAAQSGRYRPGGYIKDLPEDPWGRPYQLAVPGRTGPFDIVLGPRMRIKQASAETAERYLKSLDELKAAGVTWATVNIAHPSRAAYVELVQWFGEAVVAQAG